MSTDIYDLIKKLQNVGEDLEIEKYADDLAKMIRDRTRQGYGCDEDGQEKKKLEKLNDKSTVPSRRRSKTLNTTITSPTKSNLTHTGEMLESLTGRKISKTSGEVYLDGSRNKEIAGYHESGGPKLPKRRFMHIDKLTKKKLIDSIRKDLIKKLK